MAGLITHEDHVRYAYEVMGKIINIMADGGENHLYEAQKQYEYITFRHTKEGSYYYSVLPDEVYRVAALIYDVTTPKFHMEKARQILVICKELLPGFKLPADIQKKLEPTTIKVEGQAKKTLKIAVSPTPGLGLTAGHRRRNGVDLGRAGSPDSSEGWDFSPLTPPAPPTIGRHREETKGLSSPHSPPPLSLGENDDQDEEVAEITARIGVTAGGPSAHVDQREVITIDVNDPEQIAALEAAGFAVVVRSQAPTTAVRAAAMAPPPLLPAHEGEDFVMPSVELIDTSFDEKNPSSEGSGYPA